MWRTSIHGGNADNEENGCKDASADSAKDVGSTSMFGYTTNGDTFDWNFVEAFNVLVLIVLAHTIIKYFLLKFKWMRPISNIHISQK